MRILLFSLFVFPFITYSQSNYGFSSFEIQDDSLGKIEYHLTNESKLEPKGLMLYLDGSGAFPLFQQMGTGVGSTIPINYRSLRDDYFFAVISKPGIPFKDTVGFDKERGIPTYDTPDAYTNLLSLFWRVDAADLVIDQIMNDYPIDTSRIVILGFSEGSQVGPYLLSKNKNITHAILLAGNGLNQFIDFIITARLQSYAGIISEQAAQSKVDSLFTQYEKIYKTPNSTDKEWYGHTYKRWASFCSSDPYIELTRSDIPIYIAKGSKDENSVIGSDYIKLDFLRRGKTNLTYKTYTDCDHQFNVVTKTDGKVISVEPKLGLVLAKAFEWLKEN